VVDYAEALNIPAMVFLGVLVAIQTVICFWLKETFGIKRGEQIEELQSRQPSRVVVLTKEDNKAFFSPL